MKISNKEKIMLCILGIIIIGFGYYQLVYCVQINKIEEKTKQENEIEQKYDTARNTIDSIEDKKMDVKILNSKINDECLPFYPTISEENIILELDKLLKETMDIFKAEKNNIVGIILRAGTGIKPKQLCEFLINGGMKPSLEGNTIPIPINSNTLTGGLNSVSSVYLDALGARKSLELLATLNDFNCGELLGLTA